MRRLFLLAPLVFAALAFAEVKLPFITAHRGGRLEYDDNALGGFWRSYAAGVRGFETDIRFTRDHRFVVLHDDTLDRTTTGKGYVEEQTLAELDDVRLKVSGERLPTAEEIMNVFKGRKDVYIELEMKTYNHREGQPLFYNEAVLDEYCRRLSKLAASILEPGVYVFTSTDLRALAKMRAVDPQAKLGMIVFDQFNDWYLNEAKKLRCTMVAPWIKGLHPGDVARIQAAGMKAHVWPILNMSDYGRAVGLGADGITTDTPKEFLRRLGMKPAGEFVQGGIHVVWDERTITVWNPRFRRRYWITSKGLQEVSYVKGGKEQLAPSTPRAWVADFTRTAVGPLVMGKELGVRVTALTENGQEEIDIAPQSEDVLHRTM